MGHEGRECYYDVASDPLPDTKGGEQKILKWRCGTKPMRLTSQHIRKEEVRRPNTNRIRSRTLTYQRLRGKRSYTRRLRGEDAPTKQNAQIPKATRRRTCSYTKGYEAKTLEYHNSTRRSTFPQPKGVENSPPKTSKCQIDEKCRKRLLASSSKAPRTTHNGDPTPWESSSRRTVPGQ